MCLIALYISSTHAHWITRVRANLSLAMNHNRMRCRIHAKSCVFPQIICILFRAVLFGRVFVVYSRFHLTQIHHSHSLSFSIFLSFTNSRLPAYSHSSMSHETNECLSNLCSFQHLIDWHLTKLWIMTTTSTATLTLYYTTEDLWWKSNKPCMLCIYEYNA